MKKMTQQTAAHKGHYNEDVVMVAMNVLLGKSKGTIRANDISILNNMPFLSSVSIYCELLIAFEMAKKIIDYIKIEKGGKEINAIYKTSTTGGHEDEVVARYSENTNPSDIVVRYDGDQYLGISLKSYHRSKCETHKSTAFSNFETEDFKPESLEAARQNFLDVLEREGPLAVAKKIVHLPEDEYIKVMSKGDYTDYNVTLEEGFRDLKAAYFDTNDKTIKFKLKHEFGETDGVISWKKNTTKTGSYYGTQTNLSEDNNEKIS